MRTLRVEGRGPVQMAVEHPPWCHLTYCTFTGMERPGLHWSRPVLAEDHRTDLKVSIRLGQYAPVPGYPERGQPFVKVVVGFPEGELADLLEEVAFVLCGELARSVGWMLLSAGREAAR